MSDDLPAQDEGDEFPDLMVGEEEPVPSPLTDREVVMEDED